MIANYHTHSNFCDHAKGVAEEYVVAAIEAGIKELGFSEHIPYLFPNGYESHYRLRVARTGEYAAEISRLKEKYADKIKIHLGFEAEYYPDYFEKTLEFIKPYGIEYLILGQHFLDNERGAYAQMASTDEEHIKSYTQTVCEGMKTGLFSALCHPDMVNFVGDEKVYKKYARIICKTAKECSVPIEFNLLGFSTGRCYPNRKFFEVVAEVGNEVIIGIDAHEPGRFSESEVELSALDFLQGLGITPIKKLRLRDPFNRNK